MEMEPQSGETRAGPHRIFVIGGAYGGLSAIVTLLNILDDKPNRPCPVDLPVLPKVRSKQPWLITLLDERDGFCTCY